MKIDSLKPWQIQAIVGGDNPGCWDNPDDDNDDNPHGGPTIFIPGFPPFGG